MLSQPLRLRGPVEQAACIDTSSPTGSPRVLRQLSETRSSDTRCDPGAPLSGAAPFDLKSRINQQTTLLAANLIACKASKIIFCRLERSLCTLIDTDETSLDHYLHGCGSTQNSSEVSLIILPFSSKSQTASLARLKGPARFLAYRAASWRKRIEPSSIRSADPTRRVNTWNRVCPSLRAIDANAEDRVRFGAYGAHYSSSYLAKSIAEGSNFWLSLYIYVPARTEPEPCITRKATQTELSVYIS